jgi:hypothetical protein
LDALHRFTGPDRYPMKMPRVAIVQHRVIFKTTG